MQKVLYTAQNVRSRVPCAKSALYSTKCMLENRMCKKCSIDSLPYLCISIFTSYVSKDVGMQSVNCIGFLQCDSGWWLTVYLCVVLLLQIAKSFIFDCSSFSSPDCLSTHCV